MKYHEKTMKLVGIEPRISEGALRDLKTAEKRIGRSLPASMTEWYSLEPAIDLMRKYSNCDWPVLVPQFGLKQIGKDLWKDDPLLSEGLLVVRHENQGVVTWAVQLDESDDPQVLVSFEDDFSQPIPCGVRFSEFIFACVWDHSQVLKSAIIIQAQNGSLSAEAREYLTANFSRQITTHGWPGDTQFRFFAGDKRLLIWNSKDQADWLLTAESERALAELIESVWHLDDLRKSLWANSDRGTAILKQLRLGRENFL